MTAVKMNLVTCSFLLILLACTEASKPRSVNLALETVLEFGNNDNSGDIQIIDKVQKFLNKVKTVIDKNKAARRNLVHKNDIKLTDFVKRAIHVLSDYENDDLEDIFAVIDNELRKYHYEGCKFYELVENYNIRRFMADQLENLKNLPAKSIRRSLKYISKEIDKKSNGKMNDLFDYINSFYTTKGSKVKLLNFLDNLQSYKSKSKRANLDLVNIIRDGVRSVLFDHYSDLNVNARRDIKIKLETFWKDSKNPNKLRHNIWNLKYTKLDKNKETIHKYNYHEVRSIKDKGKIPKALNTKGDVSDEHHHHTVNTNFTNTHKKNNKKSKYTHVKHDRNKRKKHKNTSKYLSSFITLYPEEFTFEIKKNRFEIAPATERYKLQTLWNEKRKKERSPLNVRQRKPATMTTSDHGAVIDVQSRNKIDREDEEVTRKHKSRTREVRKHRHVYKSASEHKTHKTTPYSQGTRKFRKSLKPVHMPTSNEGMTIESFENEPSLRKYNYNDMMTVQEEFAKIYLDLVGKISKMYSNTTIFRNITSELSHVTKPMATNASKADLNTTKSVSTANPTKKSNVTTPAAAVGLTTSQMKPVNGMSYRSSDLNPLLDVLNCTINTAGLNYSRILKDIEDKYGMDQNKSPHFHTTQNTKASNNDMIDIDLETIFNLLNESNAKAAVPNMSVSTNVPSVLQLNEREKLQHENNIESNMVFEDTTTSVVPYAQTSASLNVTKDPFKELADSIDTSLNRIEKLLR